MHSKELVKSLCTRNVGQATEMWRQALGVKEDNFMTHYLCTDPDRLHEQLFGHFATQFTIQGFLAIGDFTVVMKNDLEPS